MAAVNAEKMRRSPIARARLVKLGGTPLASSPADFANFVADDTAKWAKVIRAANIKPE
jgi:tripartite-type tricarboxylate transporter receptor subunit TctC